ncbi:Tat pathway signal sequence domain protein [Streptomyces naphthomycinicus]|uniref:Tat pathway signal sequence domain protein n=1 Tax=Streptomyces naphthomycinicus TaxID=2872625 RepID=UPI001CECB3A4|nr:Tat pathway signal sequence domain protein [Streptomyces sp. TML10]
MTGIGPLEPGEGTRAWDGPRAEGRRPAEGAPATPAARYTRDALYAAYARYARHRWIAFTLLAAIALLAGGGYLAATRPQQRPHSAHSPAPAPYPVQVVDVTYLDGRTTPAGAPPRSFSFAVLLSVTSGPPVTVTRVAQPYAGLSLTTEPSVPFQTKAGSARKVTITMHVTKCGKAPRNASLPFLDVTLRNTRAIQTQSFIPGPRYAEDLSGALEVACSNSFG